MNAPIRVLFAEDSPVDVELAQRELKRAGLRFAPRVADTEPAFREALAEFAPDVILSDFAMPKFDGMLALSLARELSPEVPFIFVSGTLGEEYAIRALKDGATDYVLKSNLMRLPVAVERALQEARERAARREMEHDLRRSKLALDHAMDMILLIDRASMRFIDVNHAVTERLGYTREEMLALAPQDVLPASREALERAYDEMIANPSVASGMRSHYLCKDGSLLPFESTRRALRFGERWIIVAVSRDVRERIAAEQALRESEIRFRQTFELAASGMAHVSLEGRLLRVNRRLCEILGYAEDELLGRTVKEISHPEDRDATDAQRARVRSREIASARFEKRYLHKDGAVVWASLTVALARDAAGDPEYEIAVFEDITERKAHLERIERLTRVHAVLSGINGVIVRVRDRQELFREACRIAVEHGRFPLAWVGVANPAADRVEPVAWAGDADGYVQRIMPLRLGADPRHPPGMAGMAIRERKPMVANDLANDPRVVTKDAPLARGLRSLAVLPLQVARGAVGVLALYASQVGFFDDEEMKLLAELADDISFALEHLAREEKLSYLAFYDPLTGIANRTLFLERLDQHVQAAVGAGSKVALAMADVERLRTINDSLGRHAGDAVLRQLAERLARDADPGRIGRLGADQFAILFPAVKGRSEVARRFEETWHRCADAPFQVRDAEFRVSLKAGITLCPNDGSQAEELMNNAEAALRKAKDGGDRYVFYTPQMTARTAETLTLENQLRQALEREEFVLHYQPKVDGVTGRIAGVEALIRWQSPELGLVPPGRFIPLMEETGLILEVGAWALAKAVADHARWLDEGLSPPRVAVNVSAIQLRQREFVTALEEAIAAGAKPTGLDLEITESLVMDDIEGNIVKLKAVRQLGIDIAIDDFGTGYSSLGYLAKLPVQALKIDRSFIITMLSDPDTMTLVQTIISLAHSLKLKVVAEGVETEEQAKMLHLLRCDQIQGYLVGKPMPIEELTPLLAGR